MKGPLGLGSIWVTCCGVIYGMYYDDESTAYLPKYLGEHKQQALLRVNHVNIVPVLQLKKLGARSSGPRKKRPPCNYLGHCK